jgi:hypothetical protein
MAAVTLRQLSTPTKAYSRDGAAGGPCSPSSPLLVGEPSRKRADTCLMTPARTGGGEKPYPDRTGNPGVSGCLSPP